MTPVFASSWARQPLGSRKTNSCPGDFRTLNVTSPCSGISVTRLVRLNVAAGERETQRLSPRTVTSCRRWLRIGRELLVRGVKVNGVFMIDGSGVCFSPGAWTEEEVTVNKPTQV